MACQGQDAPVVSLGNERLLGTAQPAAQGQPIDAAARPRPLDPFYWNIDQVVQALCTDHQTCTKLGSWTGLEHQLRENEVTGEVLLRFRDLGLSAAGLPTFFGLLHVKKAARVLRFQQVIAELQARSKAYQAWKEIEDQQKRHESLCESDSEPEPEPEPLVARDALQEPEGLPPTPFTQHPEDETHSLDLNEVGANIPSEHGPSRRTWAGLTRPREDDDPAGPDSTVIRPAKKRRIQVNTITTVTRTSGPAAVPTEGDELAQRYQPASAVKEHDAVSYMGVTALRRTSIIGPTEGVHDTRDFHLFASKTVPPGRQICVAKAIQSHLLRQSESDMLNLGDSQSEDEDEVIPAAFGSDEEDYDEETLALMEEEEEEERHRRAAKNKSMLSKEEVADILNQVLEALEGRWSVEKKPRLEHKAWSLWRRARRAGLNAICISQETTEVIRLDQRIAKLLKELREEQEWSSRDELEQQANPMLELSLFDRLSHKWHINLYQSPYEPTRQSMKARPVRKKTTLAAEDEDVVSSSSDSDTFIDDDDDDGLVVRNELDFAPLRHQAFRSLNRLQSSRKEAAREVEAARESAPSPQPLSTPSESVDDPENAQIESLPENKASPITPTLAASATTTDPEPVPEREPPPPISDLEAIRAKPLEFWVEGEHRHRLVIAILIQWTSHQRNSLFKAMCGCGWAETFWTEHMAPAYKDQEAHKRVPIGFNAIRLFDAFSNNSIDRLGPDKFPPSMATLIERDKAKHFIDFWKLLSQAMQFFAFPGSVQSPASSPSTTPVPKVKLHFTPRKPTPTKSEAQTPSKSGTETPSKIGGAITDEEEADDSSSAHEEDDDEGAPMTSARKRRKRVQLNKEAEDLRRAHVEQMADLEKRRRKLFSQLAQSGEISSDKTRLVVNATKESDDQALIYIEGRIATYVKDHQVEGIRFMWNQIVAGASHRKGCLLAHSMGLGKTMQVIGLLVVIAQAAKSPDPAVHSQIPNELKDPKILILCPAGLVDNWIDEFCTWAPNDTLGPLYKIESNDSSPTRRMLVDEWARGGGVLVIGYTLLVKLMKEDETAQQLQESPNIVIGDEAHALKNHTAQRTQEASQFRTMRRIAMTGSPLTNSVMDYWAMINWAAPGYLSNIKEFEKRFANPIKEGLSAEANAYQKRTARRMLQVLKETVEPKVHRRGVEVLIGQLPMKREFMITLPLTDLQKRAYEQAIRMVSDSSVAIKHPKVQTLAWSFASDMSQLLCHPSTYQKNLAKQRALQDQSGKDESRIEYPPELMDQVLAELSVPDLEDKVEYSHKIVILLCILEEARRLGDKVLIFSQSIPNMNYLATLMLQRHYKFQRLDGQVKPASRLEAVKRFNADPSLTVYLISTRAGGVGLNITGANRIVIFDFKWSPTDELQAIGRAFRIGQTKPVFVYWLIAGGTFETKILNRQIFKAQLASRVVDKKNPTPWSAKDAGEVFQMPTEPEKEDLSHARGKDTVLDTILNSTHLDIRKITPTETFEEEEQYEMTVEDQQWIQTDIETEKKRLQQDSQSSAPNVVNPGSNTLATQGPITARSSPPGPDSQTSSRLPSALQSSGAPSGLPTIRPSAFISNPLAVSLPAAPNAGGPPSPRPAQWPFKRPEAPLGSDATVSSASNPYKTIQLPDGGLTHPLPRRPTLTSIKPSSSHRLRTENPSSPSPHQLSPLQHSSSLPPAETQQTRVSQGGKVEANPRNRDGSPWSGQSRLPNSPLSSPSAPKLPLKDFLSQPAEPPKPVQRQEPPTERTLTRNPFIDDDEVSPAVKADGVMAPSNPSGSANGLGEAGRVALKPVLGVNTHLSLTDNLSEVGSATSTLPPVQAKDAESTRGSEPVKQQKSRVHEQLVETMQSKKLADRGYPVDRARKVATDILDALMRRTDDEAEQIDKVRFIFGRIQHSPRFVAALVAQVLAPDSLASMSKVEVQAKIDKLEAMEKKQFRILCKVQDTETAEAASPNVGHNL